MTDVSFKLGRYLHLLSHITSHGYEWLNLLCLSGKHNTLEWLLHPMENSQSLVWHMCFKLKFFKGRNIYTCYYGIKGLLLTEHRRSDAGWPMSSCTRGKTYLGSPELTPKKSCFFEHAVLERDPMGRHRATGGDAEEPSCLGLPSPGTRQMRRPLAIS